MSLTRRGLLQLGAAAVSARKLPVAVAPRREQDMARALSYFTSTTRWGLPYLQAALDSVLDSAAPPPMDRLFADDDFALAE